MASFLARRPEVSPPVGDSFFSLAVSTTYHRCIYTTGVIPNFLDDFLWSAPLGTATVQRTPGKPSYQTQFRSPAHLPLTAVRGGVQANRQQGSRRLQIVRCSQ